MVEWKLRYNEYHSASGEISPSDVTPNDDVTPRDVTVLLLHKR